MRHPRQFKRPARSVSNERKPPLFGQFYEMLHMDSIMDGGDQGPSQQFRFIRLQLSYPTDWLV